MQRRPSASVNRTSVLSRRSQLTDRAAAPKRSLPSSPKLPVFPDSRPAGDSGAPAPEGLGPPDLTAASRIVRAPRRRRPPTSAFRSSPPRLWGRPLLRGVDLGGRWRAGVHCLRGGHRFKRNGQVVGGSAVQRKAHPQCSGRFQHQPRGATRCLWPGRFARSCHTQESPGIPFGYPACSLVHGRSASLP